MIEWGIGFMLGLAVGWGIGILQGTFLRKSVQSPNSKGNLRCSICGSKHIGTVYYDSEYTEIKYNWCKECKHVFNQSSARVIK